MNKIKKGCHFKIDKLKTKPFKEWCDLWQYFIFGPESKQNLKEIING